MQTDKLFIIPKKRHYTERGDTTTYTNVPVNLQNVKTFRYLKDSRISGIEFEMINNKIICWYFDRVECDRVYETLLSKFAVMV